MFKNCTAINQKNIAAIIIEILVFARRFKVKLWRGNIVKVDYHYLSTKDGRYEIGGY